MLAQLLAILTGKRLQQEHLARTGRPMPPHARTAQVVVTVALLLVIAGVVIVALGTRHAS